MNTTIQEGWDRLKKNDDELKLYEDWADAGRMVRESVGCSGDQQNLKQAEFRGLWNASSEKGLPFSPGAIFEAECRAEPSSSGGKCDRVVREPAPKRFPSCASCMPLVQGCHAAKKNICRDHRLTTGEAGLLDRFTKRLSQLVVSREKQELSECMTFILFADDAYHISDDPEFIGPRLQCKSCIGCIQDLRRSPQVQFVLLHKLGDGQKGPIHFCPPAVPFVITGGIGHSRLTDRRRALHKMTSDEICNYLLSIRDSWSVCPLRCELPRTNPNLLVVNVLEVGDPFVPKRKYRPRPNQLTRVGLDIIDLENPLAVGLAESDASNVEPIHGHIAPDASGTADAYDSPCSSDADLMSQNVDSADELVDFEVEITGDGEADGQVGSDVEPACQRSDMLDRRRRMMADWAGLLRSESGRQVVPLRA